ncbi:hypothetical protein ACVJF0_003758 [Bradyrhizobium elkanii]
MVKQIPALTGIRFVAAAAVALSHGGSLFLEGTSLALDISIGTLGLFGMSVFFTLSGFVIQYNYGSSIAGSPRKAIPEFLVARIARIYPLFVILFLVELLTGPMVWPWLLGTKAATEGFSWHIVPFQLGMIQTWFFANVAGAAPVWQYEEIGIVSWSVSTEWFFYLFFPLVCPVLARIRTAPAAILCAIGAGTIELGIDLAVYMLQGRINLFALHAYGTGAALPNWKNTLLLWIVYFSPFCRVWEFVLGCCLAKLHEAWLGPGFQTISSFARYRRNRWCRRDRLGVLVYRPQAAIWGGHEPVRYWAQQYRSGGTDCAHPCRGGSARQPCRTAVVGKVARLPRRGQLCALSCTHHHLPAFSGGTLGNRKPTAGPSRRARACFHSGHLRRDPTAFWLGGTGPKTNSQLLSGGLARTAQAPGTIGKHWPCRSRRRGRNVCAA